MLSREGNVEAVVTCASKVFKSWSNTSPSQRGDIRLKSAQTLQDEKEQSFQYSSTETDAAEGMFDHEHGLAHQAQVTIAILNASVEGSVPMFASEECQLLYTVNHASGIVLPIAKHDLFKQGYLTSDAPSVIETRRLQSP